MAGEKIPLVFYPRFTTFAGKTTQGVERLETTPIDVLGFESLTVTYWRGDIAGTGTLGLEYEVEQSADLTSWTVADGPHTPTAFTPEEHEFTPSMRYVRCVAKLEGINPSVTAWAVGYAQKTQM